VYVDDAASRLGKGGHFYFVLRANVRDMPVQPTRAAKTFGQREPARVVPLC